ncbi:MAG: peptidoglycan editing factor PgeF [Alphaproteobacteria bacterium]|nr:peptidoglycan editing factor PgeF [Alphaproteobacteria bacterium]
MTEPPPILTARSLASLTNVRHGFFTRRGGVSEGIFASLNCGPGSQDDVIKVAENQARAAARLGAAGADLLTVHQVHGTDVVAAETSWPMTDRPRGDGLVTDRPGMALGILTADCAPVLLADGQAGVVGAAHAGWRGALDGVLESVVDRMTALGAQLDRMEAAVGPCIGARSYEVGPEFPAPFLAQDADNDTLFAPAPKEGHFLFDLAAYVARRLARCGLRRVEILDRDTCTEEGDFFSYRRTVKGGGGRYGRNLSAIMLRA